MSNARNLSFLADYISSNGTLNQVGASPKITNILVTDSSYTTLDDTALGLSGGYIKIIGTGFTTGSQVLIGSIAATSVSFVSSTELRAQLPATTAGSYVVYVVATDGSVAIRVNGVTFSATPTWTTGSTLLDGMANAAISIQLAATSNSSVTYALASGSTLPTGLSLNSSGVLSGTITGITVPTTYNFTVNAIDAELQDSPRAFSVTITVVQQISRSLRFNSADAAMLERAGSAGGNRRTWTWSGWVKRSKLNGDESVRPFIFACTDRATGSAYLQFGTPGFDGGIDCLNFNEQSGGYYLTTTQAKFRDMSAWYHIVCAYDTTQATASNRVKIYVNGTLQTIVDVTSGTYPSYPPQNTDGYVNYSAYPYILGAYNTSNLQFTLNGYMAEVNFIDGQALTPTSFGESDPDTGVWRPVRYTGSYGNKGFYLNFSDNSATTAATLGKDYSGNQNNFTPYNFSVTAGVGNDSVVDSPTSYGADTGVGGEVRGNYATWNPLAGSTSVNPVLSNGNLDVTGGDAYWGRKISTMGMTTGKWYAEVTVNSVGDNTLAFGVTNSVPATNANNQNGEVSGYSSFIVTYFSVISGYNRLYNSGYTTLGGSCSVGDVYGLAFDADAAKIYYYKNGSVLGSASGYTLTTNGQPFFFQILAGNSPVGAASTNFGQRAFAYTAPSGFKALCSQNLPTPAIGATSTTQASKYFNTVLYTGNGNNTQSITVGFRPDFIWTKSRSNAYYNVLFDAVRGRGMLVTNNGNAEVTSPGTIYELTSYDTNGFTLGPDYSLSVNPNGSSMVAWNWNAGGTTVTNTTGSTSAQVCANPTAGFSIATWSGNYASVTVGHGLGAPPKMIIIKSRSGSDNWYVYHESAGTDKYLMLNTTNTVQTSANIWQNTLPTNSVFSIGFTNNNSNLVAYCWAEVPGYSRIGSWAGNGNADGPFVYCGFRPAFVMLKVATGSIDSQWGIFDLRRSPINVVQNELYPAISNAEVSGYPRFDILSNGFKIRTSDTMFNNNGSSYIFIAFAETPFKYARAR